MRARVYFYGPSDAVEFAALCWKNCGGATVQNRLEASVVVEVGPPNVRTAEREPSAKSPLRMDVIDALALGAAAACEAAQRVLIADPSRVANFSAPVATALMDRVVGV